MTPGPRFWEVFFEVYEALPRQGPGNRASAQRALALCRDLPPAPRVLDLGCGVGGQTLLLAELTGGTVVAVDNHAPWISRLEQTVRARGLAERVRPTLGDLGRLEFPPERFDLIWSEGALYNVGIEHALRHCRPFLARGGYLSFTDAVWRKEHPPAEVKATFDFDYPTMGRAQDVLATIARCELELVGHFTLPDDAWWTDFYTPMEARIAALREQHRGDVEALEVLGQLAREPELHRQYSDFYAYEHFVARRPR